MKNARVIIVLFSIVILITFFSFTPNSNTKIKFVVPPGWPKPHYQFSKNPLTVEGFQLGRKLFYDTLLSRNGTISCASCHLQATGFTHVDHASSHGIEGRKGPRNSMSLMNLAWSKNFMWDGGINHLEVQAIAPITSKTEMDETMENVVRKLQQSNIYKQKFASAFGDTIITGQKMLLALTQFMVQLNSFNSKYDKYIRKEAGGDFTPQEINGLQIFRKNCEACHKEPLFTNANFENNGLPLDTFFNDYGRMKITENPKDSLKFKVPTLRNIQFTQPYMHDGRFRKLSQVLYHYSGGVQASKTLSKELEKPIILSSNEKVDLMAFLFTLTDQEFLFDTRFNFPK